MRDFIVLFVLMAMSSLSSLHADNMSILDQADKYYQDGRIKKAITYYQYELKHQPSSNQAKIGLARSYFSKNKLSRALALFNDVILNDSNNYDALMGLVLINVRQENWLEAQQILLKLDIIYPNTLEVKNWLMNTYIQNGKLDIAESIHREIKQLEQ